MSDIMEAIDKSIVANREKGFRTHLGASVIGRECAREIWYSFRWVLEQEHPAQLLRLFERGHLEEFRFVKWLRDAGVTVWEYQKDGETQYRINDCDGHFGGSLDGVALNLPDDPEKPTLLEFKTANEKSFTKIKKEKVKKAKPEHYAQMNVYMYKMGLPRALYMVINKNNDEIYFEIVELDMDNAEQFIARAAEIIATDEPPMRISANPSWFSCKFCDYSEVCHGSKFPLMNCRTCAFSTPSKDGKWTCQMTGEMDLSKELQHTGCDKHLYNPFMLNGFKFHSTGDDYTINVIDPNNSNVQLIPGRSEEFKNKYE